MKKQNEPNGAEEKQGPQEEGLTRRKAIKRIAAIFAGAAVSTTVLGQASQEFQLARYISAYPDSAVYGSSSPSYNRYISYYTSYRSHYTSVPPPYSSRK